MQEEKKEFKKKINSLENKLLKHNDNFCKSIFDFISTLQILNIAGAVFQIFHSGLFI